MMLQRGLFHRVLAPGARYYLMASTFFVVVFGIVPVSLYAGSGEDWGFRFHYMLKIAALGAALCLARLAADPPACGCSAAGPRARSPACCSASACSRCSRTSTRRSRSVRSTAPRSRATSRSLYSALEAGLALVALPCLRAAAARPLA